VPVRSPEGKERRPVAVTRPPRRRRRRPVLVLSLGLALALFVAANVFVKHYEDELMRVSAFDNQYTAAHLVDYENGPTPDVVFLGSSRTSAAFVPSLMSSYLSAAYGMDVRGVNLGIASGNFESSYQILKNVIRDSRKPKLIVYGISEHELLPNLEIGHLPHTEQFLSLDQFSRHSGDTLGSKAAFVLDHVLPVFRDRDLIRDWFSIRFNESDPRHGYYAEGPTHLNRPPDGFWALPGPAPADLIEVQKQLWGTLLGNFAWSPESMLRLEELIRLAQRRDIAVALVNLPAPPVYRNLWSSPTALDGYRAVVAEVARRTDVPLLDLYEASPSVIPLEGFYDVNHLSPVGATQVTVLAAEQLIKPALADDPPAEAGRGFG